MSGRIIITRHEDKIISCLLQDNKLIEAFATGEEPFTVGDIVIGKVKNIVKNIDAAFVDLGQNTLSFLPLSDYSGQLTREDELVVQVEKEAVKTKEAVVTTKLSFPGKYAVVTTGKTGLGFSAKLSQKKRNEIKTALLEEALPFGVVIRTNTENLLEYTPLIEEIRSLTKQCREFLKTAEHRTCYSILKKAPPAYLTILRNTYSGSYEKIMTDDAEIYRQITAYLQEYQPEDTDKAELYKDESLSLKNLYGIESKLKEALAKQVWLRSGGYLVIEPTEALTVIDVNTGKYTGKKSTEETYLLINKEACAEIAAQLRLRNISGIIIVDFINMDKKEHRTEVMKCLEKHLLEDRIKSSVVDMTPLGLVEITRKKINKTLKEQLK